MHVYIVYQNDDKFILNWYLETLYYLHTVNSELYFAISRILTISTAQSPPYDLNETNKSETFIKPTANMFNLELVPINHPFPNLIYDKVLPVDMS